MSHVNFAFETVDFTGKALSQMYTAYVLVQNYEDNMKYLNDLIDNATDAYTKQVYKAVRDTLSNSYSDTDGNGILNKYLSDTENVGILIDYVGDIIAYCKDANDLKGVTDIAKDAIKSGKGGAAANPLLLIHTAVAYAADNVFKGQDIYDAAANLYLAGDAIPLMVDDLNNAISSYRDNPESDDAYEVLKLTAIFLAQYRMTALDYCKAYEDSLVVANLFFNNEYQVSIKNIEHEKEKIENLMNSLN